MKRLYIAYGSNLNVQQMKRRCPTARWLGTGEIRDYTLLFKGREENAYATVIPQKGRCVPVALWEIETRDERLLDRYEGYPVFYDKQLVKVETMKGKIEGMVYVMNPKMTLGMPSFSYFYTVLKGYQDNGLDEEILWRAVKESIQGHTLLLAEDSTPQMEM